MLPAGTIIGEVDVAGMSLVEASDALQTAYHAPIIIHHRNETAELDPLQAGFTLDLDGMLRAVSEQEEKQTILEGFSSFLLNRPLRGIEVPLMATYDPTALQELLELTVHFIDQPAQNPALATDSVGYLPGKAGYHTDIEASLPAIAEALHRTTNRHADLVVLDEEPRELGIYLLEEHFAKHCRSI